ncbi:hypothetical protein KKG71_03990 [Patescibacteria group bacterium]|nr:hypothetical protein [Patescibacteria group bacterium]
MTELKNILQNIGLSEKESQIYLACLELGNATVGQIAKKACINRVTAYDILEKMLTKGLVNLANTNNKTFYQATDPEALVHEFERKISSLHESLPALKRLKGDTPAPRVRYFEGLEGIKTIYEDTLTSRTEILNFANSAEIRKSWPNYDTEYVANRIEKKIYLRGITPDDPIGITVVNNNFNSHREIRLINKEKYNFPNDVNIYDNKTAIISFAENNPIGIIIQDESIANTQRSIFEMAWSFAELR